VTIEGPNRTEEDSDGHETGFAVNIPPLKELLKTGISHVFYKIDPETNESIAFEVVLKPGQMISELEKLFANISALRLTKK
jgi:hypothetical protein